MGGLKNGKNGGEPNGFCLVFVIIEKSLGQIWKVAPLSLNYFGRFSICNSALFIHSPCQTSSQPISGQ